MAHKLGVAAPFFIRESKPIPYPDYVPTKDVARWREWRLESKGSLKRPPLDYPPGPPPLPLHPIIFCYKHRSQDHGKSGECDLEQNRRAMIDRVPQPPANSPNPFRYEPYHVYSPDLTRPGIYVRSLRSYQHVKPGDVLVTACDESPPDSYFLRLPQTEVIECTTHGASGVGNLPPRVCELDPVYGDASKPRKLPKLPPKPKPDRDERSGAIFITSATVAIAIISGCITAIVEILAK